MFQVTGAHDKSLRIWEKTDEPLFVEEEREKVIMGVSKLKDYRDKRLISSVRSYSPFCSSSVLFKERETEYEESVAQGPEKVVSRLFVSPSTIPLVLLFS